MKKTIKYGGLAASLVAATVPVSGAFADTEVATGYNAETCAIITGTVEDDVAKTSASLQAQANAYKASATCKKTEAADLAGQIRTAAEAIVVDGENIYEATNGAADYTKIIENAAAIVDGLKEDYEVADLTDASLMTALGKGSDAEDTPWALAKAADGGNLLIDEGLLLRILDDGLNTYNQEEIVADFEQARVADEIIEKINKRAAIVETATALDAKAATFQNAADKTKAAEEAAEAAEDAADDAKGAVDAVRHMLIEAEDVVDDATLAKLEAALEKAKKGELDEEALAELIEEMSATAVAAEEAAEALAQANTAAAEAATALTEAETAADDAADAVTTATAERDAAKDTADDAAEDVEDAQDDLEDAQTAYNKAVSDAEVALSNLNAAKNAYDEAKAAKDAADAQIAAAEEDGATSEEINELKADLGYTDLVNTLDDAETARDDAEDALDTANGVVETANDEVEAKQTALNVAQDALTAANTELAAKEGALTTATAAKEAADQAVEDATAAKEAADQAVEDATEAKAAADEAAEADEDALAAVEFIAGAIATAAEKVEEANEAKAVADEAEAAAAEARGEEVPVVDPTDPTNPTDPTGPTDPTDPTEPTETEYTYKVLNGADQVYTSGSDLSFRFDGDHTKLDKVYINNVELDSKYYTVKKGSTVITLSDEYLATLSAGEYTLKATWTDGGEGEVKFTIADAEVATPDTGAAAAGATSAVSSLVGAIMTATLAGAAVVIRKRIA